MSSSDKNGEDYEMDEVNRRWRRHSDRMPAFFLLDYTANPTDANYIRRHVDSSTSQARPRQNDNQRRTFQQDRESHQPTTSYQALNYTGDQDDRISGNRRLEYNRQTSFLAANPHSSQNANYTNQLSEYSNPYDLHQQNVDEYSDVYNRWSVDDQSELVNRYHRTTSIHRNAAIREPAESLTSSRTFPRSLEDRRKWMNPPNCAIKRTSLEQRAKNIANRMEQDEALMEDTPESEQLRREALRDMPQCLTVKRIIKKKLNTSVSQHSKRKPLGLYKSFKYRICIKTSKAQNSLKSLAYTFELWYSSLKTIEGHFGSGVATYFKFFRWLFIMNCLITLCIIGFIVIPQLLYINIKPSSNADSKLIIYENGENSSNTSVIVPETLIWSKFKTRNLDNNVTFAFANIFTGEGYFTDTTLYYGFYTNNSVNLIGNQMYNMPYAYFFTMFFMYLISFIVLSTSMARSYRRSFIETQGGLKNVYAHKIFCGWDYSIATHDAADLKASSIHQELKELLSDSVKKSVQVSMMQRFWTFVMQLVVNITILILLAGTGYVMWYLLEKHSPNSGGGDEMEASKAAVATAVIINIIMMVFPPFFSFVIRYEDYKHPRAAMYVTLIRTFLLKTVVVGVFLAFWLTHSQNESCWETSIGQHIYRLILFDFLFSVVTAALVETVHYFIYQKVWKTIGAPTFDIARYTLQLMYNQTLFWVGLYFSPVLAIVVILKLWCTWYVRRTCILSFCQPSSRSWRAAQTQTWFLILSFLSLLLVLIAHGYIMVNVATSNCGPFRGYKYMYEMILIGIFQLEQNNVFWKALMYLTKPGAVALILVAMCVSVYYLRAKGHAQKDMVDILRNMLVLEAKDKEFLLENISKVTEGKWQYNLQDRAAKVWDLFENATAADSKNPKPKEDFREGDDISSSNSDNIQDLGHSHSSSNLFLPDSPETSHNYPYRKKY